MEIIRTEEISLTEKEFEVWKKFQSNIEDILNEAADIQIKDYCINIYNNMIMLEDYIDTCAF